MAIESFEEFDTDFKLDDIMEEKQQENNVNDFGNKGDFQQQRPSNRYSNFEAKKIIRKIGEKLSPEEIETKQKLIIQISRFRDSSRFANFLNSLGFNLSATHLKSMDIGQLEDLLLELKSAIQNKNGSKFIDESYFMILNMVENISKHPKFNKYADLSGLSKSAHENDEILDVIECLSLMYSDMGQLSPEKKLVFLTGSCILQTASLNRMLKNIQNYEQKLKEQVEQGGQGEQNTQKQTNPVQEQSMESQQKTIPQKSNEPFKDGNVQLLNFDMIK